MALAERLPDDASSFLKNTRNLGKQKNLYKAMQDELPLMMATMAVIMMMKMPRTKLKIMDMFQGVAMRNKVKTFSFSLSCSLAPLKQRL